MSKSANKTLVGAFVVGATALLCAAVMLFGSGKMFRETTEFVLFFNKSISGLNVGAPVVFRGVPVGQVTRITITGGIENMNFQTPVYIELDTERMDTPLSGDLDDERYRQYLNKLLESGLRARLTPQSMITGQLMVELDFFSNADSGPPVKEAIYYQNVAEIPTIPSRMDSFLNTFGDIPFDEIGANILDITTQLKTVLHQGNVNQLFGHLDALVTEVQRVMGKVDSVVKDLDDLSASYTRLANTANTGVETTVAGLDASLKNFNTSLKGLDQTLSSMRGVVGPNTVPVLEFSRALREFSDAARSIRAFINMLDRNPEALLRGKGNN